MKFTKGRHQFQHRITINQSSGTEQDRQTWEAFGFSGLRIVSSNIVTSVPVPEDCTTQTRDRCTQRLAQLAAGNVSANL
ncbi:hypothetical protein J6590_064296 [Homalodisca vitripennis]|nr:hypothetical protein J6590_064296 [Homalodisca vitripennis]